MHVLHALVKPFKPKLVSSSKQYPAGSQELQPHATAKKRCKVSQRKVEGVFIYDLESRSPHGTAAGRRVYYFAGGGWQQPPSSQHWKFCAEIVNKVPDTTVSIVSHPLAPNSPASAAMPQLQRLYTSILAQSRDNNETVVFAGDSSGANVALGLIVLMLTDNADAVRPSAIFLISPALDLRPMSDEGQYQETNSNDPILTIDSHNGEARQWAADMDPALPWISPLNADPTLLYEAGVQIYGVTGGYDILTPDALAFKQKCEEARVTGQWLHWEKQMHCFPLAFIYGLPESVQSKDWIIDRLKQI